MAKSKTPTPVDEGLDLLAVTFTTALLGESTWVGSFAEVVDRVKTTLDAHVAAELEVEFTVTARRVTARAAERLVKTRGRR